MTITTTLHYDPNMTVTHNEIRGRHTALRIDELTVILTHEDEVDFLRKILDQFPQSVVDEAYAKFPMPGIVPKVELWQPEEEGK